MRCATVWASPVSSALGLLHPAQPERAVGALDIHSIQKQHADPSDAWIIWNVVTADHVPAFNNRPGRASPNQSETGGGGARPTKITTPSAPGLPGTSSLPTSISKLGFQLLMVQMLPAASIWRLVWRMSGE
jgi:hypothetical protein